MDKIFVVIPTYNEADNLPVMAAELWALNIPNLCILVVDDSSPDGTGQVADELADQHPDRLYVMHRKAKEGLGRAYVAGFNWALDHGATHVIQMDCDFSHSPQTIPTMLEKVAEYDVVVGSRYVPGGQVDERWETGRFLLSWWANAVYARLLLNLSVRDTTAGYKCWRAETLRGIDYNHVGSHGYSFQVEMAYLTEKLGYSALEIPIYFEDRRIGKSKMSIPIKIEAALRVWQILWRYRKLSPQSRVQPVDQSSGPESG